MSDKKILLVDDEPVKLMLELRNYEVRIAYDGSEREETRPNSPGHYDATDGWIHCLS